VPSISNAWLTEPSALSKHISLTPVLAERMNARLGEYATRRFAVNPKDRAARHLWALATAIKRQDTVAAHNQAALLAEWSIDRWETPTRKEARLMVAGFLEDLKGPGR